MSWIVKLLQVVGKAVVWVAQLAVKVVSWALANPVAGLVVGVTLIVGGEWIGAQTWWGAEIIGSYVAGLGYSITVAAALGALTQAVSGVVRESVSEALRGPDPGEPYWEWIRESRWMLHFGP